MAKLLQPKKQLVLAGYGEVIRYPNSLVAVRYRFYLGRVGGIERDGPAEQRQVAIQQVTSKGIWRSKQPEICYVPPRRREGEEWPPSPIWFRWSQLHLCKDIVLVNGSTRKRLAPELYGVRIDERVVLKLAPNGAFARYTQRGERYLPPEEIQSLLRLGIPG